MYTVDPPADQPSDNPVAPGTRALVVGAGWLGGAVAHQLAEGGVAVHTLQRTPHAPACGITPVAGDIATAASDAGVRRSLPHAIDWLVLCLAPSAARGDDHTAYPRGVAGALALAEALGAQTLLYTSSTGVYGRIDGGVVRETDPLPGAAGRVGLLRQAEAILADAAGARVPRVLTLRVAGLYGPGRDPAPRWKTGDPHDTRWVNMAWRDDVVSAIRALLAAPLPAGAHCFNCCDGAPVQAGALVRALRGEPAAQTVPAWHPEGGAPAVAAANAPGEARGNQQVSAAALCALRWAPQVPTAFHGLRALGHAVALPDAPLSRP